MCELGLGPPCPSAPSLSANSIRSAFPSVRRTFQVVKMPPKPHSSYCRMEAGGECLPLSQHTNDFSLKLTISPTIYLICEKGSSMLRELLHLVRPNPPYGEGSEGQKTHGSEP